MKKIIISLSLIVVIIIAYKFLTHEIDVQYFTENIGEIVEHRLYTESSYKDEIVVYQVKLNQEINNQELTAQFLDEMITFYDVNDVLKIDTTKLLLDSIKRYNPKFEYMSNVNFELLQGEFYITDLSLLKDISFGTYEETKTFFNLLIDSQIFQTYTFNMNVSNVHQASAYSYLPGDSIELTDSWQNTIGNILITSIEETSEKIACDINHNCFDSNHMTLLKINLEIDPIKPFNFSNFSVIREGEIIGHLWYPPNEFGYFPIIENSLLDQNIQEKTSGYIVVSLSKTINDTDILYLDLAENKIKVKNKIMIKFKD